MQFDFEKDPRQIEVNSFKQIRSLVEMDYLDQYEQQVAMRVIHSLGMPELLNSIRFSKAACQQGMCALKNKQPIICDVEMVKSGITKRMIDNPPLCFLNQPAVLQRAQAFGETRSMAQVESWLPHLEGAIVVIGNAPTALFRLLEMIDQYKVKPALIIGMPVGFIGAAEAKQALWDCHKDLAIACITLLGHVGGSAVASASCNALLRCIREEFY